ncbi:MAG: sugar phosphate isomerase/epimerase [Gemmatimonadaceae bacterium]|jgi:sugar phosphate isomerase/epimerase|nr:sugar phosphate isomerase/epimerase [Gemmatimonadaceae bacterium]
MSTRRDFLKLVAAASATGAWHELHALRPAHVVRATGVQLYTLRTLLDKEFDRTLAALAAMGYREVEFAGYYGRTPQQIASVLAANGLSAPSAHIDSWGQPDRFQVSLDAAGVIGHRWLVLPWIPPERRGGAAMWRGVADTLLKAVEPARERGARVAYHNHEFEFAPVEGSTPLEILMQSVGDKVDFELDCYWVTFAKRDPIAFLRQHPGRVRLLHLKDAKAGPKQDMTSVGDGTIDWKTLLKVADDVGVKHRFVEHDNPTDPLASVKASITYLSKLNG